MSRVTGQPHATLPGASNQQAATLIVSQINADEQAAARWMAGGALPCDGACRDLRITTRDDMRAFAEARFEAELSAATISNALSVLRRVFSLHVEAGLLDINPATGCGDRVKRISRRYAGADVFSSARLDHPRRQDLARSPRPSNKQ
jgi:hypothetical protein